MFVHKIFELGLGANGLADFEAGYTFLGCSQVVCLIKVTPVRLRWLETSENLYNWYYMPNATATREFLSVTSSMARSYSALCIRTRIFNFYCYSKVFICAKFMSNKGYYKPTLL